MKNSKFLFLSFCILAVGSFSSVAQTAESADTPEQFINSKCPQLYSLFKDDMSNVHATYTFAVDVSGTMNQYADVVQPALVTFINALPNGDYVRIIRFGNYAKGQDMGYCGIISDETRKTFAQNVSHLYTDTNDKDIRQLTNIPLCIDEVANSLQKSQSDLNFVFILTDFKNEEDKSGGNLISDDKKSDLHTRMSQVSSKQNGRIVTLKLPLKKGNEKGFCLAQVNDIFSGLDLRYNVNNIPDGQSLQNWFLDLRKEVMINKLRAVVDRENRISPLELKKDINIDGKVEADVKWQSNRMFTQIKIDSTSIFPPADKQARYRFNNNRKAFRQTDRHELKNLKLGQIKANKMGFSYCKDSLLLGITLPTNFDDELAYLGVDKPIPHVASPVNKLIFTFPLPFWMVVTIIILLIIYAILVIHSVKVNSNKKFKIQNITITDANRKIIVNQSFAPAKKVNGFNVPGLVSANVPWKVEFYKEKGNPFVFGKPKLKVKKSGQTVLKNGTRDHNGRFTLPANYSVGTNKGITHYISIR